MYTLLEAITKIQELTSLVLVDIQQEDGSGFCWNYKTSRKQPQWTFIRLPKKRVVADGSIPATARRIPLDLLRHDVLATLRNLCAEHSLTLRECDVVFTYDNRIDSAIFYVNSHHITIEY